MSELAKHLPLSQRESVDESQVSTDWSAELGGVLRSLSDVLERMPHAQWSAGSARSQWSIRDTVALLRWQLTTSPVQRFAARARHVPRHPFRPGVALERRLRSGFALGDSPETRAALIAALRTRADSTDAASVAELSFAVCAWLDVVHAPNEQKPEVPIASTATTLAPRASGAVAVRQVLRAPLAVRAAARGNTLVASDAGWQLGHGPAVVAESEQILLFLFGRTDRMPGR